jgi:ribose transport system permease protein
MATNDETALRAGSAATAKFEKDQTSRRALIVWTERLGLPVILIVEIVIFSLIVPNTFAQVANFQVISSSMSVLLICALALMYPLIAGRFDVSVGAQVGLTSVATAAVMSNFHLPLIVAVVVALLIGAIIGTINGLLVAYLGVNSIIATIGTSTIMGGVVQAYTNGVPIQNDISPVLLNVGSATFFQVPIIFIVALVISAVAWYHLNQRPFGRYIGAVGSNERAAVLNGVRVRSVVMSSFIIAGVLSGAAGVLQVATSGSGNPQIGGLAFILSPLAAVFLGATVFTPGKFNVGGSIIALLFISTTISGLILTGMQPWVSDVLNGAAVVIAISIAAIIKRKRTGVAEIGA